MSGSDWPIKDISCLDLPVLLPCLSTRIQILARKEVRMAGQIRTIIDKIIEQRSKGNVTLANTTRTKLLLKGIDPGKFSDLSPDDPAVIARLQTLANELSVTL
jgi:hypothetical protein